MCRMADIEPASAVDGGRKVTAYQLDSSGKPTARLGTATIVMPSVVVLDFPRATLELPLGISAMPETLQDPGDGRPRTDHSRLFHVASIHLSEPGTRLEVEGQDSPRKSTGDQWALELSRPVFLPPPPTAGYSARSFWCILFPRLEACNPH